jgi:hypothetical protein
MKSRRRLVPSARTLLVTYLPPLLVLVISVGLHELDGVDFGAISRDQAQEFHAYPLVGAQSTIAGLVWFSAATVAFLTVALLRRAGRGGEDRTWFLAVVGLFTLIMGVDDIFMLHDELGPRYLNIDETPFILFYIIAITGILVVFRRTILRLDPLLLCLAVAFLAGSVVIDHFQEQLDGSPYRLFFEDGFKFLGIVGWCGYLVRQCWFAIVADHDRHPVSSSLNTTAAMAGPRRARRQGA